MLDARCTIRRVRSSAGNHKARVENKGFLYISPRSRRWMLERMIVKRACHDSTVTIHCDAAAAVCGGVWHTVVNTRHGGWSAWQFESLKTQVVSPADGRCGISVTSKLIWRNSEACRYVSRPAVRASLKLPRAQRVAPQLKARSRPLVFYRAVQTCRSSSRC
jgi:hypothetical protein